MQRRRRTEVIGGSDRVPPITPSLSVGVLGPSSWVGPNPEPFSSQGCTCGAPGGVYGHERHCGEVEPAPKSGSCDPQWTSADAEDLEF